MDLLNPDSSYDQFFAQVAESKRSLLMLDYDGTLSPFTTDRDNARPYPQVVPLIRSIVKNGRTRIVIISGRSVEILRELVGDDLNCELWGSHGAERFIDHEHTVALDNRDGIIEGLAAIDLWSKKHQLNKYLEIKSLGRAFHWRGESDETAKTISETVEQYWSVRLDRYGLSLHYFDGGIELRPKNISKADAVMTLLFECAADITLAYLGDDLTDEEAFTAIGNRGLKVLVRSDLRETSADIRITPPEELIAFLSDWREAVTA